MSQTIKVLKDNAIDNERVISVLGEQIRIVIAQCSELERDRDIPREKADEATQAADVASADLRRDCADLQMCFQLLLGRIRKLEHDNEALRKQLGGL